MARCGRWPKLTGGPDGAHQIINSGSTEMRDRALSNVVEIETCEYPDSGTFMIGSGKLGEPALGKMFRSENPVPHLDREGNEPAARQAGTE